MQVIKSTPFTTTLATNCLDYEITTARYSGMVTNRDVERTALKGTRDEIYSPYSTTGKAAYTSHTG